MVVITGASNGIGKHLIESFIKEQSTKVIGTYLSTQPVNHIDNYYKLDVRDENEVNDFVDSIKHDLNNITLINCAGISYNSFLHKSDLSQWKNVIDVNLFGVINMVKALLPIMRKQNFGRIINFSSVTAQKPTPGVSAYATSKAALWGFSKSVAIENANKNITINNINLGYSKLGLINEVPERFLKQIIEQIPMGTLCEPEDIFNTINYLISTNYITGTSINLNGGLT